MRRQQLFKRILAGSLILGLTVLDAMPAMAADMQSPDSVIEAESEEAEEALLPAEEEALDAAAEEEVLEPQTETKEAEGDTEQQPKPTVKIQGAVDAEEQEWDDSASFRLSFSTENCDEVELTVKASTGAEVYSTSYYTSGEYIYSSRFNGGLTPGVKNNFTFKSYRCNI